MGQRLVFDEQFEPAVGGGELSDLSADGVGVLGGGVFVRLSTADNESEGKKQDSGAGEGHGRTSPRY